MSKKHAEKEAQVIQAAEMPVIEELIAMEELIEPEIIDPVQVDELMAEIVPSTKHVEFAGSDGVTHYSTRVE